MWVTDFEATDHDFLNATNSTYLWSENLPSPMGLNLTAFQGKLVAKTAKAVKAKNEGEILDWQEVLSLVKKEWL